MIVINFLAAAATLWAFYASMNKKDYWWAATFFILCMTQIYMGVSWLEG